MCQLVTITLLCPICQVNVVGDPKFETISCRDVRKGRACPSTRSGDHHSSNTSRIQFRQELGEQECRPCEQYTHRERDRLWAEAEAAAHRYGRTAEYYYSRAQQRADPYHPHHQYFSSASAERYAGRYRAPEPQLSGDRELQLASRWRWDDNYSPPPSRSGSPAPSSSSHQQQSSTTNGTSSGSSSSSSSSDDHGRSSSASSSDDHASTQRSTHSGSSDSFRDRGLHGDGRLNLHSARYW